MTEETTRRDGPVQMVIRMTTEDVEIADTPIPSGRMEMLLRGSANRDEPQFEAADRFDITRRTSGHLGFGFGVHFCPGASLARLEDHEVERVDSLIVRGPKTLGRSFRPA